MNLGTNVGGIYYNVTADTGALVGQTRVVERETQTMAGSFNVITAAIKVMAAALAAVKMAQLADEMRMLSARVQVATGSIETAASAMRDLVSISVRTQTSMAANVQVFTRLNQSLLQMGGTQADTLRITELLGMAIKVSGASAAESSSAMLQFGQALGSGKLAGDELRSLLENAPYLMRQLAAGLGVPIGALKSLGEQGKLTADVVVNALSKAAGQIGEDFKKMPQTLAAAWQVAIDAALRFNEKLDEQTGKSAALTGITKGLGEVFEKLSAEIDKTADSSDRLGRNEQVEKWADRSRTALSYLLDGIDFVYQKLSNYERPIKNLFGGALGIVKEYARVLGIGSGADSAPDPKAPTLGARLRAGFADDASASKGAANMAARRGAARDNPPSKLTPPPSAPDAKAAKKAADERTKAYVEGWEAEQKIMQEQDELSAKFFADQAKREEKAAADRARGVSFAQDAAVAGDPVAQLQLELQRKSQLLTEYAILDQENLQVYAEAKVALERDTQQRIADIQKKRRDEEAAANSAMLQNYGSLFGGLADLAKTFAGEQSGIYKAMFSVSKAFAIADATIKLGQAIMNANFSAPFPLNFAAMASVSAAGASVLGSIKGTQFGGGRQYGGPVDSGRLYRVNETGRPEMFTGANGSQYMLPTKSGNVTPANEVGAGAKGGTVIHLSQQFAITGPVDQRTQQQIGAAAARGLAIAAARNN